MSEPSGAAPARLCASVYRTGATGARRGSRYQLQCHIPPCTMIPPHAKHVGGERMLGGRKG